MGEGGDALDASPRCGLIGLSGKLCKTSFRRALVFPIHVKDTLLMKEIFPVHTTSSAHDLRSLERTEKEIVDVVNEFSPRGIAEGASIFLDLETNSSKTSTSCSDVEDIFPKASLWHGFYRQWKKKSMRRLSTFPPFKVPKIMKKSGRLNFGEDKQKCGNDDDFCIFGPSLKIFSFSELEKATNGFSEDNLIGKGGFSEVYKGELEDGHLVAVKRLLRGTQEERTCSFLSELGIIAHMDHPNVAKLVGVGVEEGMHLVLQFSPNGNLKTLLHGSKAKLDWGFRYKIALGIAEGLVYLHDRCQKRIIHRDIKPSNILLTEYFEPQICDFGLAKWLPDQLAHHISSSVEGTFGYVAPEYSMHGIVDEKTDVFAFGILLLELISGRQPLGGGGSQGSLVGWARPIIARNNLNDLVDPSLEFSYDKQQLKNMAKTADSCIQSASLLRPPMRQVCRMIRGDEERTCSLKIRQKPPRCRTFSDEIFDLEEYNGTRYLKDLTRHMQLALDFDSYGS